MSPLEKRIRRLERDQKRKDGGVLLFEALFVCEFKVKWLDEDAAPRFALAEYRRLVEPLERARAK